MSDNPFADAVEPTPRQHITREPSKPFFHYAIEQDKLRQRAQNMTRQQMFDNGFITVQDLDDEELRYGKCRDAQGRIPKRPNKTEMVPRDLYDEMVIEHQKRTDEKLRQQLDTMLDVMVEVATDDTVEPRDRMDAAKYLFERVAGKTAERVAVSIEKAPWEEVFSGVAKISRERSHALREGVIDAEVVEPLIGEADRPEASTRRPTDGTPNGATNFAEADTGFGAVGDVRVRADSDMADTGVGDGRRGVGERGRGPTVPPEVLRAHIEDGPFAPTPKAPSWDNPVSSSSTIPSQRAEPIIGVPTTPSNSEALREAQRAAKDLAERKANARKRIQEAKKRRIVQRATGANLLRRTTIDAELTDDKLRFSIHSDDTP